MARTAPPAGTDPESHAGEPRPPAKATRRRAETRARLQAAAAEVFAERGFGRATVEDVCDRAGFTRGAFYSNFVSLDELFFALYTERADAVIRAVDDAVRTAAADAANATAGRSEPALQAVMHRVLAALPVSREHHLLNLEFTAHALRDPAVAATLAGHRRELRQALLPILRIGLSGAGVAFSAERLDDIGRAVIAVHDGMFVQELLEPDNSSLPALRQHVLTLVVAAGRS